MEKVWVSPYQLESKGSLNARSGRRIFEGVLIRDHLGFSCLHPWPELGDPSLQECLEDLKGARRSCLVRKSLSWLEADGRAREEGRSLFEGAAIAKSHATLPELCEESVQIAVERGFSHIKTKAGREISPEIGMVRNLGRNWPKLRWRIDFNGSGKPDELIGFFGGWSEEELERIDFLEDPGDYCSRDWQRITEATGLATANDRFHQPGTGDGGILVLKPAVDEISDGPGRRVVTSYMDHPLGQCFAAWESSKINQPEIFGLQTHGLFEWNQFSGVLGEVAPDFTIPPGKGIGFDDLLEGLDWRLL